MHMYTLPYIKRASQAAHVVKNSLANARDMRHGFDLWIRKVFLE